MTSIPLSRRLRVGVREKLALILLVTLFASLTVSSFLQLRAQEQDILEEIDRRGNDTAHFLGRYLAYSVVSYDYHTIELILQDLTRSHDIVYARVDNSRGNIMAVAGTPSDNSLHVRQYSKEIRLNGEVLGLLTLSLSTERIVNTLAARQREAFTWQTGAILLVMISGFAALSILIVRPLTIIARTIRKNLGEDKPVLEPIPLESHDEFGDLARGFNALGDRLNEAQRRLEARIDVADRELRGAYEQLANQAEVLRVKNSELEQLSITDPLTGLYNRRYFERLMENEVSHAVRNDETISILLIDIDRFKSVNEQLGYNGGDTVIRHIARAISEHIRKTDVACRYGGDEFFVLCRRATIANSLSIADGLLQRLAGSPVLVGDKEARVTATIGIATIPGIYNIASATDFFQCANEALLHGKQNGRNVAMHYSMIERNIHSVTFR